MKCHICEEPFPVKSVAMLHCFQDKTFDEDGDKLWLLQDDDWVRVPV